MADFFSRFRKEPKATNPLDVWLALGADEDQVWSTLEYGPPLADVMSRISSVPHDFFDPAVDLVALAGDVLGRPLSGDHVDLLVKAAAAGETRRGAAVVLWVWASEDVLAPLRPPLSRARATRMVAALAFRLAPVVDPSEWLVLAERREEAARLLLLWSGQLPAGEDALTARSLWDRHDSLRRNAALAATLGDHQHRLEVMRKLREKHAAEAAARYSHE